MTLPTSGQIDLAQIYNEYWKYYPSTISDQAEIKDLYYGYQGRTDQDNDMNYFYGWQVFPAAFYRINTPDEGFWYDSVYTKTWHPAASYDIYDFDFYAEVSLGGYSGSMIDVSLHITEQWGTNVSFSPTPFGSEVKVFTGSATPVLFNTRDTRMTGTSGTQEYDFALTGINPATWRIYITNRTPYYDSLNLNVFSEVTVRLDSIWFPGLVKKAARIENLRYALTVQTIFNTDADQVGCVTFYDMV